MEIKTWMILAVVVYVVWTWVAYKRFQKDDLSDIVTLIWVIFHIIALALIVGVGLDAVLNYFVNNPDINVFNFTIFTL